MSTNFDDLRKKYNSAYRQLKKMNVESLNFFSETHDLKISVSPVGDLQEAQKYISYKYLEKMCALNAISIPEKWRDKLAARESAYIGSTNVKEKDTAKRGSRAAIIKRMLLAGCPKSEIIMVVAERFPHLPLSNIGCQIAATKCFLKRKEKKDVDRSQEI